jgi:hypothetical protein
MNWGVPAGIPQLIQYPHKSDHYEKAIRNPQ